MRRNRSQRGHRNDIIAVAIVTSIAAIGWVVGVSAAQSSTAKTQLYPWAFAGATAVYSGTAYMNGIRYSMTYTIHVIDVNSTKAEVFSMNNVSIGDYPPGITHHVEWVPALKTDALPFMLAAPKVGLAQHMSQYNTSLTIRGSSIPVTAYTVDMSTLGGPVVTGYFAERGYLPIALQLKMSDFPIITMQVVTTNIPGLLP